METGNGNIYRQGLDRRPANFTQLSPISFITRTADIYPDRPAVIYGGRRDSWATTYARSRQLAGALAARGIGPGDTVSLMLPNVPAMVEAHFGIPFTGAVINALNIRLDAPTIAFMLDHSEAKILLTDPEFAPVILQALGMMKGRKPLVIDVPDPVAGIAGPLVGEMDYDAFLATGDPDFVPRLPEDEWDAIALSYTSGTTGDPKGVVTHHRGAYLNAVSNVLVWTMPQHPVYLWTLPLFHCNGWCFPWVIASVAGTNVCLRRVDTARIFDAIRTCGVTHYCGAPIVHAMMADAPAAERAGIGHRVFGMVAGAPPPPSVFKRIEAIGIDLIHVYGLTETYGPAVVCAPQDAWDALDADERIGLKARQGVRYTLEEAVDVLNPDTMEPVPRDGETVGEIMFRGNAVMKGYLKNAAATDKALAGGWFHSGDLAVVYPDGYIRIKDRSKDVIISGGENISSIEVEDVLHAHPDVQAAAVVAMPDEKWGEVPAAFVELRPGARLDEAELIAFARERLARFKTPKKVIFSDLPRTSTGKIQKFALRQRLSE